MFKKIEDQQAEMARDAKKSSDDIMGRLGQFFAMVEKDRAMAETDRHQAQADRAKAEESRVTMNKFMADQVVVNGTLKGMINKTHSTPTSTDAKDGHLAHDDKKARTQGKDGSN